MKAFIVKALGNIAKAKGMAQLSKDTGLGRECLYKALSGGVTPNFDTVIKVVKVRILKADIFTLEKPDISIWGLHVNLV